MSNREAEDHFDRGIHFFRGGLFPAALFEFRQVEKIDPDYPNISYLVAATQKKAEEVAGKILAEMEEAFDADIAELSKSLQIEGTTDLAGTVERLLREGRYQEALAKMDSAETFVPDSRPLLLIRANALRRLGRGKDAEKVLRRALTLYPSDAEVLNNLGNCCLAQNQFREARGYFQKALKLVSENLSILNNLGALEMQTYRLDEAVRLFEQILKIRPGWLLARRNLENVRSRIRELDREISKLRSEYHDHETYYDIGINLGKNLLFRGFFAESEQVLLHVIAKRPTLTAAHFYLGNLHEIQDNLERAIQYYRELVIQKDKQATSEFRTFTSLWQENYREEALYELKKLAVLDLDPAGGHINLGIRYFEDGNWKKALEHFEEAVSIHAGYADGYYWQALAKIRLGKTAEAMKAFEGALEVNPRYADAHYQLGMLLRKRSPKKAYGHLHKALECAVREQFAVIARDVLKEEKKK
jgi:tetratricopeptide (TPR) repeat protein